MKITGIELDNVKGFQRLDRVNFSETINVFIGPNNSGKSTILNSIFKLQIGCTLGKKDITVGREQGFVTLYFNGTHKSLIKNEKLEFEKFFIPLVDNQRRIITKDGKPHAFDPAPNTEPDNLIYPYLSKRKSVSFDIAINEENTNLVSGNFTNLYSKIDRLATPQYQPGNSEYIKACKEILGFEISTIAKGSGKQAALYIYKDEHIPLNAMGEGVTNIIGLITDLCVAENNIFLIEEPENDIHPKALKALLDLIESKSNSNQFFISTHSNIVMKHLGAARDAKIFNVTNNENDSTWSKLMLSSLCEISNEPFERKKVLEDLGYEFFDFDLWKAWLFLEESSAEIIIREYLIKWFVPELKYQLRTFSAGSVSRIHPKFDDFNKLFVFLHLEPSYKNKVWIYIDSGLEESQIISNMQETYSKSGWDKDNFNQFSEHDFEKYYPYQYQKRVDKILEIKDKQLKRKEKNLLLAEIKSWIENNEDLAKIEFEKSASEIIEVLKVINGKINNCA